MAENRVSVSCDENNYKLIKYLESSSYSNTAIIDQIHRFFFTLPKKDFYRLSRPMCVALIAKLSSAIEYRNKNKEKELEISQLFLKILPLLSYLGYRISYSINTIPNLVKMFQSVEFVGFSELAMISKFLVKAIDPNLEDNEFNIVLGTTIATYYPIAIKRADNILSHPKEIGPNEFSALDALYLVLPIRSKLSESFNREFQVLINKHQQILSQDIEKLDNFVNYASYIYIINKLCFFTFIQPQAPEEIKNNAIKAIELILRDTPPTLDYIIKETFKTVLTFLKVDRVRFGEFIGKIFPLICTFKNMNPKSFGRYSNFAKQLILHVLKLPTNTMFFTELFCKYTANALLYYDLNLIQRNTFFKAMTPCIKIPSRGEQRWRLFELFFMSFFLELKEITLTIERISERNEYNDLRLFYATVDSFNKIILFFDAFLRNTRTDQASKMQTGVSFFDPNLNQRVSHIICLIFAEMLYTIEVTAKALHTTEANLRHFQASDDYNKNIELLIFHNKDCELFTIKLQGLHKKNIQMFIDSTSNASRVLIDISWQIFLDRFFHSDNGLTFATSLFWTLTNYEKGNSFSLYPLSIFLKNLASYIDENLENSSMISKIIVSTTNLFRKIIIRPSLASKRQSQIELINNSALKIIHVGKSLVQSRKHCAKSINLIIAVTQYVDYIYGDDQFSRSFYNAKVTQELLEQSNINSESALVICKLIEVASSKLPSIRTNAATINALIRVTPYCQLKALQLLRISYKEDKTILEKCSLTQKFAEYLYSQIDVANPPEKEYIIKAINHLPANVVTDKFDSAPFISGQKFFLFERKESNQRVKVPLEKMFTAAYKSIISNNEDKDAWKLLDRLIIALFNVEKLDTDYRQFIQVLLNEAFSFLPQNSYWDDFFLSFLDSFDKDKIAIVSAHFLIAYLSTAKEISNEVCSYVFNHFSDEEEVSQLINELMLIIGVHEITDSYVMQNACMLMIEHISHDSIDPIVFSNLVILMINRASYPKKRDYQRIDDTLNFMELSVLPHNVREIIKFARDNLKEHDTEDISSLLNQTRTSSNFLTNIAIGEIISKYETNKRTVDLADLIDNFDSDDINFFKVTGTLFRALKKSFNAVSKRILAIADQKIKEIENRDEKYQSYFMAFMVPVLMKTKENVSKYRSVLKIAYRSFLRSLTPFSLVKCQSQLIVKAMYTKGDSSLKEEINKYCNMLLKDKRFPDFPIDSYSNIRWRFITGNLFSVLFIKTDVIVDNMNRYLELFPPGNSDKINPCQDLYENLVAFFNIVSTGFIISHLKGRGLYEKFSRNLIRVYSIFPMLQITELSIALANFFVGSEDVFTSIIAEAIDDVNILSALVPLSTQKKIQGYFINYINNNRENIIKIVADKTSERAILLTKIMIILEYHDDEIMSLMIDIHKNMTLAFKDDITKFDCNFYLELTQYICKKRPEFFFNNTEYIFTQSQPVLNAFYFDVFEEFFDKNTIKKDFIETIFSNYEEKENIVFLVSRILKFNEKLINSTIEYIVENTDVAISLRILNKLCDGGVKIDYSIFEPLQIYDSCQTDDDRINALEFWCKSKSEDNFMVLFNNACSFINECIDLRIERIISTIIVPKSVDPMLVAYRILNIFNSNTRNYLIISVLFRFLSNNKDFFPQITKVFLHPIQDTLIFIESLPHQEVEMRAPLFKDIVECITLDGLSEEEISAIGMHTAEAGLPIVKAFVDVPETMIKFKNEAKEIIKAAGIVAKLFPTSPLPLKFFELLSFYAPKAKLKPLDQKAQNDAYLYRFLFEGTAYIVEGLTQNTEFAILDTAIDIYSENIQDSSSLNWHFGVYALSAILHSQKWRHKTLERIRPVFTHQNLKRTFPLMWEYSKVSKERNLNLAFETARALIEESPIHSSPIAEIIIHSVLLKISSSTERYIISLLLSPNAGCFESFILDVAFRPCFSNASFVPRFIECLKNQHLAINFFNRVTPSEEIINKMPLETLLVLATQQNVPKVALDRIHTFPFKDVLFTAAMVSKYEVPFERVLSALNGLDLTSVTPFFEANDLIASSVSITENTEIAEVSVVKEMDALIGPQEEKFSAKVLSEFPEFGDSETLELPSAEIYSQLGMASAALHSLGVDEKVEVSQEKGRKIISDASFGSQVIIDAIKKNVSIEDKLEDIFSIVGTMEEITTRKGFGEYLIFHEVKRIASDLKKHTDNFKAFTFKLKPVHSPALHVFYKKIREATFANFTVDGAAEIDKMHMHSYNKSFELYSPTLKKEESFLGEVEKNLGKILVSLLNEKEAPLEMKENAAIAMYKVKPDSPYPFLLMLQDIEKCRRLLNKISSGSSKIPFAFSPLMAKMIAKSDSLSILISLVHPAFYISLHCYGSIIPQEFYGGVTSFINAFQEVSNDSVMQTTQKVVNNGRKLIKKIRGEITRLPKGLKDECSDLCSEVDSMRSRSITTVVVEPIHPPLLENCSARGNSLTFIKESKNSSEFSVRLSLTNGDKVMYTLSTRKPMTAKLALLTSLLTKMLRKSPGSFRKGQELLSFNSIEVCEGFFLSKTQSTSLFTLDSLQTLLEVNEGEKREEEEKEKKHFAYKDTAEYAFAFSLFGSRYAALSLTHLMLGGAVPSPIDVSIDEKNSSFAFAKIDREEDHQIPRLCGKVTQYIDRTVVYGPFRIGILSAADCFARNKAKIDAAILSIFKEDSWKETAENVVNKYSTVVSGPESAIKEVNSLIELSYNSEEPFAIPWI